VIRLEHVTRSYPTLHGGTVPVLRDVNLDIGRGEKIGIIGKNGAGKSTLIRLISGAELPDSGKITRTMTVSWPLAFAGGFQPSLTGLDNLRFICRIYGQDWRDHLGYVEDFTELGRFLHEPLGTYSSGMRSRLAFALSMVIDFDCFLIDEIMAVGDHRFHEKCRIELFEKRANHAMIIVSHDPGFVRDHCDRLTVLAHGITHDFDDSEQAYQFYLQDEQATRIGQVGASGRDAMTVEAFSALLFGPDHADALEVFDFEAETATDLTAQVLTHRLNADPVVGQYRLDHVLTEAEADTFQRLLQFQAGGDPTGRSLHGILAEWAESTAPTDRAAAFLSAIERAVPLEGGNGLWQRMSHEAGAIRRIHTFIRRPTGQELPISVRFDRHATDNHVFNELAQFEICPSGVVCHLQMGLPVLYAPRLFALYPIILPFLEDCTLAGGFNVSLGDEGHPSRTLSFCSIIRDFLIPDPVFIQTGGYSKERELYGQSPAWSDRRDVAYWRGTDTGVFRYRDWPQAPRVAVCLKSVARPDLIDARITKSELRPDWQAKKEYYDSQGIFCAEEDQSAILSYRYQIDIDGNTNTWSGLFLKLLSGSPVLKIDSEFGFRQWYYDRLVPFRNFVPVRFDTSDLVEKIEWLRDRPEEAQRIGREGRELALSIGFEASMIEAQAKLSQLHSLSLRSLSI
jgi:capsular polysaccharide transport system ATP-binding protein